MENKFKNKKRKKKNKKSITISNEVNENLEMNSGEELELDLMPDFEWELLRNTLTIFLKIKNLKLVNMINWEIGNGIEFTFSVDKEKNTYLLNTLENAKELEMAFKREEQRLWEKYNMENNVKITKNQYLGQTFPFSTMINSQCFRHPFPIRTYSYEENGTTYYGMHAKDEYGFFPIPFKSSNFVVPFTDEDEIKKLILFQPYRVNIVFPKENLLQSTRIYIFLSNLAMKKTISNGSFLDYLIQTSIAEAEIPNDIITDFYIKHFHFY